MVAPGDDAGGELDEAFAAQEPGQRLVGVDAAAVQLALAVGEAPEPLGAGGGLEPELDGRELLVEAGGGGAEDGLGPRSGGGDAKDAGAPRAGGVDGGLGVLELAQDAPRALGHGGRRGR